MAIFSALIRILAVALLVAGCGASGIVARTSGATELPAISASPEPSRPTAKPIAVAGSAKTGASAPFKLAAGTYAVTWSVAVEQPGCAFYLFLAKKFNGPTVKDIPTAIMPAAKTYDGTTEWTDVPAGTYVLQEDRSGLLNCTGLWDATLTRQ